MAGSGPAGFFNSDDGVEVAGAPFGGAAPFFTGVLGGIFLSMYSGEMYGPKDTRLPDPLGVKCAGMLLRADKPAVAGGPVRRGVAVNECAGVGGLKRGETTL